MLLVLSLMKTLKILLKIILRIAHFLIQDLLHSLPFEALFRDTMCTLIVSKLTWKFQSEAL